MTRRRWWPEATKDAKGQGWAQPTESPIGNEGRSGSADFNASNVLNSDLIPQGQRLCAANFRTSTPSVVQIRVYVAEGSDYNAIGHQTLDFVAEGQAETYGNGVLIFEYGSGITLQRVAADLKSGSYQLPPCEQVRIYAACYFGDEAIPEWSPAITVFGAIAEGVHLGSSRPTYTIVGQQNITLNIDVPDNAREVDCYLVNLDPQATTPPAVVLTLSPDTRVGLPFLVRDYSTGVWTPPYPAQVNGSGQEFTLTASEECGVAVQFTLEL